MINKQSLWFVTLFSLIIILSIYYFSSDTKVLSAGLLESNESNVASVSDDELLVLKVANDEATLSKIEELQSVLLDEAASLEEKNDAYDELQVINTNKAKENEITNLINDKFDFDSLVKIKGNQISILVKSNIHNNELAGDIIRSIKEITDDEKYITVKFQDK